jgi:hypothetical protein
MYRRNASLRWNAEKKTMIPNPDNPTQKIPAFECQNVPDYKVPWVPQKK